MNLKEKLVLVLLFFYSFIVLVIDYVSPLGLNVTALHIPIIIAACFLLDTPKKLYVVSSYCCILIIIGFFVSPDFNYLFGLLNRIITIIVIIVINILGKFFIEKKFREKEILNKLKQSNDELSQFAYRTSHDLKSPLTTIKRLANYIKEDIASNNINEAISNIEKVGAQAKKLETLVTDILNLAKADLIENSKKTKIIFTSLINDIIEKHSVLIEEKDISIVYDDVTDNQLLCEQIRISQILENLITNGIKYSDPNKENRYVKIKTKANTEIYTIIVEDNGLGIPEDKINELFQIFKRFHPQVASGSGMGLSIVKKHIEKLNAKIEVTSIDDKTTFKIKIPIR